MLEVGILKNFDSGTYKAIVQLAGSVTTYFDDISVAKNIPVSSMIVGNYVILAIPGGNPKDACVIATWPSGSSGGSSIDELNDIGDVNVPSPSDDDVLYWDQAAGKWQAKPPASGMQVHGNEYHDPNFVTEDVLSNHVADADAHHDVHLKTLDDHPLSIIPTMDDDHIPASITRDTEVFMLQKRGMDEWWKTMDGWTQVTANGGSDSHALMRLEMQTSSNLYGRVARYCGACRSAPQWNGQRGLTRIWIANLPADCEIRFYIVHQSESFDPLIDTEEHGGFKIIDGDIYASVGNGTDEEAEDTGVNLPQGGTRYLEVRGVGGTAVEFYVDQVLKKTLSDKIPTVHTSNYCYCIEIKNKAASNKKIRVTYIRHTD